jgi:hypothetical protein
MSKMFFEVKKYIPEKHIFDIMNFFKENKVNFNTFKSNTRNLIFEIILFSNKLKFLIFNLFFSKKMQRPAIKNTISVSYILYS